MISVDVGIYRKKKSHINSVEVIVEISCRLKADKVFDFVQI